MYGFVYGLGRGWMLINTSVSYDFVYGMYDF